MNEYTPLILGSMIIVFTFILMAWILYIVARKI